MSSTPYYKIFFLIIKRKLVRFLKKDLKYNFIESIKKKIKESKRLMMGVGWENLITYFLLISIGIGGIILISMHQEAVINNFNIVLVPLIYLFLMITTGIVLWIDKAIRNYIKNKFLI